MSSYFYGTLVWNTATRQFVRGPANPLCAPTLGSCRGAAHAAVAADGTVYQAYLGTVTDPPRLFVYRRQGSDYAAAETLSAGSGPLWVDVRAFR